MKINRRALYNSLRMNWVIDPTTKVDSWQVEDYRSVPLDGIFERLEEKEIFLDKTSFLAFADTVDTPEDLTDALTADMFFDAQAEDQVYLLVFELWRRLLPEKPCLSVFCDELDHQIHLYDRGQTENSEAIQDVLANLQVILDENTDEGANPVDALDCINQGCANDVETFLYDFTAEQIDNDNGSYASELLDGFADYVHDQRWFDFLRARLLSTQDPKEADRIVRRLVDETDLNPNLEFNLELLAFLVRVGDQAIFEKLIRQSIKLLQFEEDFQDIVSISADFYHRLDREQLERTLQMILQKRTHIAQDKVFDDKDPQLAEFLKIVS
jgi:hypothetical protein